MPMPDKHEYPIHRTSIISDIKSASISDLELEKIKVEMLVDIRDELSAIKDLFQFGKDVLDQWNRQPL